MPSYPHSPSHRTFQLQSVTISSDFDSGNCGLAQKLADHHYSIQIETDHPKNNYRTWFHFYIEGVSANTTVKFTITNMQNQSKLLNEGLVPVYREQGEIRQYGQGLKWNRINQKLDLNQRVTIIVKQQYQDKKLSWSFRHQFRTNKRHYFAFFYPWSNEDNQTFLRSLESKAKNMEDVYLYRGTVIRSIQGRPVDLLVISSGNNMSKKKEEFGDDNLFTQREKVPYSSNPNKKVIVISARVHPGEVPGSHVMTGILKQLMSDSETGRILRDQFVFYIFPILNPDGVGRGHYRVDTNGINLNRCYLNPNPKTQPSIYAIKKIIMYHHALDRFFAYLDLHAHASRRGTFIYGNCSDQLMKQMKICLFPKLLSMNSADFEYQGSNFTQKNMYCKDRGDHMSKQGSGRVAIFKATKNPYCWTLQCNYNISRINNILDDKKDPSKLTDEVNENNLQTSIITEYWQPKNQPASDFFTIQTFHKLGKQICESFLDLVQKNSQSRIDTPTSYFKSIKNVKMHLALALLKMAPNRFENSFKKIYYGITNSENKDIIQNSLKALYFKVIVEAQISNVNNFIKTGNMQEIGLPVPQKTQENRENSKKPLSKNNVRYRTLAESKKNKSTMPQSSSQEGKNQEDNETSRPQSSGKLPLEQKFQSLNLIPKQKLNQQNPLINESKNDAANIAGNNSEQNILIKKALGEDGTCSRQLKQKLEELIEKQQRGPHTHHVNIDHCQQNQQRSKNKVSFLNIGEFKAININKVGNTSYSRSTKVKPPNQCFRVCEQQPKKSNQTTFDKYRKFKDQQKLININKHIKQSYHEFMIDSTKDDRNEANMGVFVYGGIAKKLNISKKAIQVDILKNNK